MPVSNFDFNKDIDNYIKRLNSLIPEGLEKVGERMLDDANEGEYGNKPPILDGTLRRSKKVFVFNREKSVGVFEGDDTLAPQVRSGIGRYEMRAAYLVPYAFYLHENPNWWPNFQSERREPGRIGYKWLQMAVEGGAETYNSMLAEFLDEKLK